MMESGRLYRLHDREKLDGDDYQTILKLRAYRHNQGIQSLKIKRLETRKKSPIPGLSKFLNNIKFVPNVSGIINRRELEYLTGGWFEEYVYHLVVRYVQPQDIALGVVISRPEVKHCNELDVIFTKGNKLFVIECKTGVQNNGDFMEYIYKACAIKEALLGVSCYSYIFSLNKRDNGDLKRVAGNMETTFVDRSTLISPKKLRQVLADMYVKSMDGVSNIFKTAHS